MTTFLIDGYNLMHAMGYLAGKVNARGLERARVRFQDYLVAAFGEKSPNVTIVYDAARIPHGVAPEQTYQGLNILLAAAPQEADDLIETWIAKESSPKSLVVVSSDRRLQIAARCKGAVSMACPEFLDFVEKLPKAPATAPAGEPEKSEHMSDEEIDAWMQEFTGLRAKPRLKDTVDRFEFEDEKQ
jgi:predicted RNA-binding protein with PIN domain